MLESAQNRKYEDAAEYKNLIEQIDAAGNKQIVRDAIQGDATIIVALQKYEHIFIGIVEIRKSMIIGMREYTLTNPLDEEISQLIEQAITQYTQENSVKNLYTDIILSEEIKEFMSTKSIRIYTPSRGEKMRILEFAHTNLLNFAYHETIQKLGNITLSKKTMLSLMQTC